MQTVRIARTLPSVLLLLGLSASPSSAEERRQTPSESIVTTNDTGAVFQNDSEWRLVSFRRLGHVLYQKKDKGGGKAWVSPDRQFMIVCFSVANKSKQMRLLNLPQIVDLKGPIAYGLEGDVMFFERYAPKGFAPAFLATEMPPGETRQLHGFCHLPSSARDLRWRVPSLDAKVVDGERIPVAWAVVPLGRFPANVVTGKVVQVDAADAIRIRDESEVEHTVVLDELAAPAAKGGSGKKGKDALSKMVSGRSVRVEYSEMDVDPDGRIVGKVYLDKRCVNTEVIKEGWASRLAPGSKKDTAAPPEAKTREEELQARKDQQVQEKAGPDAVVVKKLDAAMPAEEGKRGEFLWNQFSNKPEEEKFALYGTQDWEKNYKLFADALVAKARENKLEADSLQKVLDLIRRSAGGLAYLPVGAYQSNLDKDQIWIVVVKWEGAGANAILGHIRMFAYDQKTLKKVAFETCM